MNVYLLTQLSVIGDGKAFFFLFSSKTKKEKENGTCCVWVCTMDCFITLTNIFLPVLIIVEHKETS